MNILISHHRGISHGTNWFEKNSEEVMEWDERSDADSSTWSSWNWNSWKTNRGNTWNETTTLRHEDYDEAPPLFPDPVLAWFFSSEKRTRGKREKHDIGSYKKQILDQVEQALKIQFPDDEIRYHDDRTGKHHNTLLGGAVEEEEEQMSVHEESHENSDDDLDALAKAQEEEAEALTS